MWRVGAVKEYHLRFVGIKDIIIVSSKVLESLIPHVYDSSDREMIVDIEELMPGDYSEYVMEIINTNRGIRGFEYEDICAELLARRHIYQILQYQLKALTIEAGLCFLNVCLPDDNSDSAELDVECSAPFYWACKDSESIFWYMDEAGKQIKLIVGYNR